MASLTTKQLVEVIRKSGLIEAERLRQALLHLQSEHAGKIPSDSSMVGNFLLDQRLVTAWQYSKLRAGKFKGFFLGNYRLLDHLGSGGMSSVYLADHNLMNRMVAIKVLPPRRVGDKSYLERFYLEAKAVAALDHPNIVRAYDVDCELDTHYFVMEYVPGSDLARVISDSDRLPAFAVAADYIVQAARGLQHAHDAGLIHRDVKPANLLVDRNGTIKLLDLGLALVTADETSLTQTHQEKVLGTADYLAPEQALDSHDVDARADIYGLGCTFYSLLTGRPPFHEGTLAQRIAAHQSKQPPRVRELRPDCPEELADICHRMMEKNPEDRFPSAVAVAEALDAWRRKTKAHLPVANALPLIVTDRLDSGKRSPAAQITEMQTTPHSIQLSAVDIDRPLAERKRRRSSSKKPPLLLWIVLGLMTLVAMALFVFVVSR